VVVGAGPSIERTVEPLIPLLHRLPVLAADGSARALLELGVIPYAIATDLDGDLSAILDACRSGATIFLHAHGDNVDKLVEYGREIAEVCRYVVPTTQFPRAPQPLVNVGGFTDGDRCCAIAYGIGFERLLLIGMDLNSCYSSRYSKGFEERLRMRKMLKLVIAKKVIDSIARRIEVLEVGSHSLLYSKRISIEEARTLVHNWLW